jgi:hypothetical protein
MLDIGSVAYDFVGHAGLHMACMAHVIAMVQSGLAFATEVHAILSVLDVNLRGVVAAHKKA